MAKKLTRIQRKAKGSERKTSVTLAKDKTAKKASPSPEAMEPMSLPSAWHLGWKALQKLWFHRYFWLVVVAAYLLIDLILVRSVAAFDVANLKSSLSGSLQHGAGAALGGLSVLSSLYTAAASGASADVSGAYHFFVVLLMSLVVIWSLRQMFATSSPMPIWWVKEAFYQSTTPLVPFLLLLLLIGVQLVPLFVSLTIYSFVVSGGIANTLAQQIIFLAIVLAVSILTLYWLARSVVALYIVTLPNMLPMQAYMNAKDLVKGRRMSIIRKIIFLPFALFVLAAIIMVPCIIIWAPLAQWLFFVLTGFGFVAMHAYLYTLYRELLGE